MLSNRYFDFLAWVTPFMVQMGAGVYHWDSYQHKFVRTSKSGQFYFGFYLNTFCLFFWILFQIVQLFHYFKDGDPAKPGSGILFTICVTFLVSLMSYTLTIVCADEWFQLINSMHHFLFNLNHDFVPEFNPNSSPTVRLIDIFGLLIFVAMVSTGFLNVMFYIMFPFTPNLPASTFLDPSSPWYFHAFLQIFTNYNTLVNYVNLTAVVEPVYIYGVVVVPLLVKEFRVGLDRYKTISALREPVQLRVIYRAVQILQGTVNDVLGRFLVPMQSVATLLFIFCSFVIIRHGNRLDKLTFVLMISWALLALIFWSAALIIGGYIFLKGTKTINSWKRYQWSSPRERKIMMKWAASCRPITISYGRMFIMKKSSLLIFIRGLCRGLMRTLLTIK